MEKEKLNTEQIKDKQWAEVVAEFRDFYYETGKYINRERGFDAYVNFFHSHWIKREKKIAKHNRRIQNCLDYCKEYNGMPACKNCGLCEEDLLENLKKLK